MLQYFPPIIFDQFAALTLGETAPVHLGASPFRRLGASLGKRHVHHPSSIYYIELLYIIIYNNLK